MKALGAVAKKKLIELAEALIDQKRARILIPPLKASEGFWFGSGSMVKDPQGRIYLCGRYRNSGDSRTGLEAGERGAELAVFRSEALEQNNPRDLRFAKILSLSKRDLSYPGREVVSIEGSSLYLSDRGAELFVSSEKAGIPYPEDLQSYQKPNTGVWTIDVVKAPSVEELDAGNIENLFESSYPEFMHYKDPVTVENAGGDLVLLFCTHSFNWSSTNSAYTIRPKDSPVFCKIDHTFFPRGFTWDVAISRITAALPVPRTGIFTELPEISLLFYDGGESLRDIEQRASGVRRPRGYSCEELGGLAFSWEKSFPSCRRLSRYLPQFVTPYGSGCSRYYNFLPTDRGIYALWQQSQKDLSQPLVMNYLATEEVRKILC